MSDRPAGENQQQEIIRAADFTRASNEYLRKEFPDADESLMQSGLLVLRLATAFQQDSERTVHRPLDLRWTGFSTVFALSIFGQLEARSLARIIGVSRQAVSLVITTLERDGFITREQGDDRRTFVIQLTERGREVAREALEGQIGIAKDWFGGLEPEELAQLTHLLERVLTTRSSSN
ncbi:MarR family winged helix-turn-helix transcriptional regulator [Gulosibacter molinativorax]|uniref:MarR family transcriptional regulator n=1 Tax=Gulosibacter molinativorax TaxID=256821 RepID=A0ABT7C5Y7_9MICO|nr:MarR family transcriptional regulator [Gulosibacter molinativorax]MDJ1370628.1 MarR family transcriptional regulator [Gulosibacter molinativorax]QUY61958.1 Hypotetical protein [Gulosibacter molinativorax]